LAVLARLDPPEAYLPEGGGIAPGPAREAGPSRPRVLTRTGRDPRIARASGIVGLCALILTLLAPLLFLVAELLGSEEVLLFGLFLLGAPALIGGIVAVVLGVCARLDGAWAIVGLVTGLLALLLTAAGGMGLLLLL
jgi:hypothetical protein